MRGETEVPLTGGMGEHLDGVKEEPTGRDRPRGRGLVGSVGYTKFKYNPFFS